METEKRNDRTPSQATAPVTKNCKRKERILFCHLQMEPRLCQQSLGFRSAASGTERECAFCYFQLPFWDNLLLNMELLDVCKIITLLEKNFFARSIEFSLNEDSGNTADECCWGLTCRPSTRLSAKWVCFGRPFRFNSQLTYSHLHHVGRVLSSVSCIALAIICYSYCEDSKQQATSVYYNPFFCLLFILV